MEKRCFQNIGYLEHNNHTIDEILKLLRKENCSKENKLKLDDELCRYLSELWNKKTQSRYITYYRTNGTIVDDPAEYGAQAAFFIIALNDFFSKVITVGSLKAPNCEFYAGFYSATGDLQSIDEPKSRWVGVLFDTKREDLAHELRRNVASRQLRDFAVIYPYEERIKKLASMCMDNPDEWSFNHRVDYFILKNYLNYTFMKLDVEEKIFDCFDGRKYFNTGLFAKGYRKIYAVFEPNKNGQERMFLSGFFTEDDVAKFGIRTSLDDRANYFAEPRKIIFNPSLEVDINLDHIVVDRFSRWEEGLSANESDMLQEPQKRKAILAECIERAKNEIRANYKMVVPHYFVKNRVAHKGRIQLLIPLRLKDDGPAFIALSVEEQTTDDNRPVCYKASTCLSLAQAYSNARLIVRPGVDWLKPENIIPPRKRHSQK